MFLQTNSIITLTKQSLQDVSFAKSFFFQELLFGFSAQAAFGIMDCSNFNRQQKIQPKLAQAPDSEEHFNMCLI